MNNLYVRLAKNNLKNNKSLYVPYMVAGMITVLIVLHYDVYQQQCRA